MLIQEQMGLAEKLTIWSDASPQLLKGLIDQIHGIVRAVGNAVSAGLCHSFGADGRSISCPRRCTSSGAADGGGESLPEI